ncbi:MAG: hypothetical protein IKS83_05240 [Victivallales bacterium]|nr:hypothetical protein [Victivallales bacterium]
MLRTAMKCAVLPLFFSLSMLCFSLEFSGMARGGARRVEFSNADFEQGRTGWELPRNGTLEQVDERHGLSAKLVVGDPKTDAVYITRQLPVEPGKCYFAQGEIKTEGVVVAEGRMPSVGACLIVEWADRDRKWLTSGVYSKEVWGSGDWTKVVCDDLRAPTEAGYATIFLALRGKGIAWFDNVEFYALDEFADKTAPADGAVLATNVPRFEWLSPDGIDTCEVLLSQNADFPAAETITYTVEVEDRLQLREPLQPGVWHWRVNVFGNPDPTPYRFTIDVPSDARCLPPQILADHSRLLDPSDRYTFSIECEDDVQEVTVSDLDTPTTQFEMTELPSDGKWQILPHSGWKDGLNAICITATASNGAVEAKEVWIVCAPKPEKVVVIDQAGRFTENGERIFPLGIYQVAPEEMPEVKAAGFEVVHSYAFEGNQDDLAAKKYLDAAAAAGLRVFIGFDRGNYSKNGIVQGNFELLARRVGALASHPGLFCWYLFDEPEVPAYYVPPKQLTAFAELLRQLDPYHPVVMTTWGDNMNAYRKTWDTHWTQCYAKPAEIVATIADHRRKLLYDSPITLLIHCYDKTQSRLKKNHEPVNWDAFEPDYDWMRAAALAGITQEVNGLWWWWYAKSVPDWMTAAQNPRTWNDLCRVVEEVRALRPVLNAEGAVQTGTVEAGDAKVEWWMKTVAGKHTIIIVNTSESEVEATIAPQGVAPIPVRLGRFGVEVIGP